MRAFRHETGQTVKQPIMPALSACLVPACMPRNTEEEHNLFPQNKKNLIYYLTNYNLLKHSGLFAGLKLMITGDLSE